MSNQKLERAQASLKSIKKLGGSEGLEKVDKMLVKKDGKPPVKQHVTKLKPYQKSIIFSI